MRTFESEFKENQVDVRIVSFDANFLVQAYQKQTQLTWPILIDENKDLYKSYGMIRGTWWKILRPSSILKYLKLIFAGNRLQKSGKDLLQLGGNVLVDPEGMIRVHHISDDPHDRPSGESLLQIVESASK